MYKAQLKGGPLVGLMLQAKPGKSGKQEKQQISPNLGTAFLPSPVNCVNGTSEKTVPVPAVEGELAGVTYDIIFSCTF